MGTETSYSVSLPDEEALKDYSEEYRWVHLSLGLLGNTLFFAGSVLFLFQQQLQAIGVWAFVVGSFLMLVRALGEALVKSVRSES